jgi:hypothetical protein
MCGGSRSVDPRHRADRDQGEDAEDGAEDQPADGVPTLRDRDGGDEEAKAAQQKMKKAAQQKMMKPMVTPPCSGW